MRETWLSENQRLVSQDNFGTDLASVEVSVVILFQEPFFVLFECKIIKNMM